VRISPLFLHYTHQFTLRIHFVYARLTTQSIFNHIIFPLLYLSYFLLLFTVSLLHCTYD
jgi:cytochrome c biogenesis protein ResB